MGRRELWRFWILEKIRYDHGERALVEPVATGFAATSAMQAAVCHASDIQRTLHPRLHNQRVQKVSMINIDSRLHLHDRTNRFRLRDFEILEHVRVCRALLTL